MATDDTTRTPAAKDGDAAERTPTTETTPPEGRNDQPKVDKAEKDALVHKVKAEHWNQIAEAFGVSDPKELIEKLSQAPAATDRSPGPADEGKRKRPNLDRIRQWAETQDDDVAAAVLELIEDVHVLRQGTGDAFAARELSPDLDVEEDEEAQRRARFRKRVLAHYERNRHRLGDLNAAAAEVRQYDMARDNKALRERLKLLDKKPDPDVLTAPPTEGRERTARESSTDKMRDLDEFDAKVAQLESEGKMKAALLLRQKLLDGKIQFARA